MEASGDAHALVMELVAGPTLAERLESGPLPLNESLSLARQIAEALEEAHEKGIIHRDLKPQNIKASIEGKVKVLDFGLAKAMDPVGTASGAASASQLAQSPTLTLGATVQGMILGTAAYMAPEQARGVTVDKRADIWAFGVVLFEMLTGKRLFEGELVTDVLAQVLTRQVDLALLPAGTPSATRRLLRRCLERNPKNRLHDIADARIVLDELITGAAADEPPGTVPADLRRVAAWKRVAPWVLAVAATALWSVEVARRANAPAPERPVLRLPLDLGDESISLSFGAGAILSPDGGRLAWVTGSRSAQAQGRLMVRELDSTESRLLAGTEGAQDPVFSPDGEEIAFFSGTSLLKVPVAGGTPVRLAEVGLPRGVTWLEDGSLIYNRDVAAGLWRVPASGGTPEMLTEPTAEAQERSHRWPRAVRGTRKIVFLAQAIGQKYEESTIELFDLDRRERSVLHRGGSYPRVTRDGILLYVRDRAVWAAPLDAAAGRLEHQPLRVLDEVGYSDWSGGAQFDVADDSTLVYSTGLSDEAVEMAWFEPASGRFERIAGDPAFYYQPALSPDGRSLAVQFYTIGRSDLWIFDLGSGARRRLTFGARDEHPIWSPDGRSLAYSRMVEGGSRGIVRTRVDGGGEPVAIAPSGNQRFPTSWSSNGALLFTEISPETHSDVWVAWPDDPDRAPEPLLATPANESRAVLSPDGRWMAYESDESGTAEVFVRSFRGPGGRWQLSEQGGGYPRWTADGRAVYFWTRNGFARRELRAEGNVLAVGQISTYRVDRPVLHTEDSGYAVGADGRLLVFPFSAEGRAETRTILTLGWGAELESRLRGAR